MVIIPHFPFHFILTTYAPTPPAQTKFNFPLHPTLLRFHHIRSPNLTVQDSNDDDERGRWRLTFTDFWRRKELAPFVRVLLSNSHFVARDLRSTFTRTWIWRRLNLRNTSSVCRSDFVTSNYPTFPTNSTHWQNCPFPYFCVLYRSLFTMDPLQYEIHVVCVDWTPFFPKPIYSMLSS